MMVRGQLIMVMYNFTTVEAIKFQKAAGDRPDRGSTCGAPGTSDWKLFAPNDRTVAQNVLDFWFRRRGEAAQARLLENQFDVV